MNIFYPHKFVPSPQTNVGWIEFKLGERMGVDEFCDRADPVLKEYGFSIYAYPNLNIRKFVLENGRPLAVVERYKLEDMPLDELLYVAVNITNERER